MKLRLRKLRSLPAITPALSNRNAAASNEIGPSNSDRDSRREILKLSYEKICDSYHNITDFRAKLLALLPLATGTGGILLLREPEHVKALGPIGLFGVVVTVGLFMYEVRGIQRCHVLEQQAKVLERRLQLRREEAQFLGDPGRVLGFVGPPGAGIITYGAVTCAWLFVAGVGFDWWSEMKLANARWLVVGYVGWLVASLTFVWYKEQRNKRTSKIVLTEGLAGEYLFTFISADGQRVMTSQSYENKATTLDLIESLRRNGLNADLDDQTSS